MTRPIRPWTRLAPLGALARRARRVARSGDGGATLIYALIFITIAAIALGAILAFADTSMRTTVTLRGQAAQAAAADGAAQIAINNLRRGNFVIPSTNCPAVPLSNFYQTVNGNPYSATVQCTVDTTDSHTGGGGGSDLNFPTNAILTVGTSGSEDGLFLDANGSQNHIGVSGKIFSNSNIVVSKLVSDSSVTARTGCSGNPGTITSPSKNCNIGSTVNHDGDDPQYPAPTGSPTSRTVPGCNGPNVVVDFLPGLYTDLNKLNKLTKQGASGCNGVFYFHPGVYWFDLGGEWLINNGYVVGGKAPDGGDIPNGVPTMPGACRTPIPPNPLNGWTNPASDQGVEFVFGGTSRIHLGSGSMEICGKTDSTTPPIAIYGYTGTNGPVPSETGTCVASGGSCPLITSDNSPNSSLYIDGTVYAPAAFLNITLNNRTGQVFGGGVIARRLSVSATGSADLTNPIISLPNTGPADADTVLYLEVWACAGTSPCSTSGPSQLKVKVGIDDPNGTPVPGARQVTVYAWSNQR